MGMGILNHLVISQLLTFSPEWVEGKENQLKCMQCAIGSYQNTIVQQTKHCMLSYVDLKALGQKAQAMRKSVGDYEGEEWRGVQQHKFFLYVQCIMQSVEAKKLGCRFTRTIILDHGDVKGRNVIYLK